MSPRPRNRHEDPVLLAKALDEALDELRGRAAGERRGVGTGLVDLDRLLGGLRAGQLDVIGARPSVGKTALAFGIALHVAVHEGPVLFLSAEMSRLELALRTFAGGGVPSERLLAGRLDALDFERLEARRDQLGAVRLMIDDSPGTLSTIEETAARQQANGGLALVGVDYLQLIPTGSTRERRELEVAEVSRGLKMLARNLGVPVVAVAQLNRGLELRGDKRPMLADLRDSGQVEQDADVVILLHRPAVYDLDADPAAAELIVAKHRSGPTGVVHLIWLPQRMRFVDAAPVRSES